MEFAFVVGKLLVFWQIWSTATASDDSGGFLFTAPRTFLSGNDEKVCITFKSQNHNFDEVKVKILKQKEDVEIAYAAEKITETDRDWKCFEITIPRTNVKNGRLQLSVHLKTDGDFNINYVEQISIEPNPDIAFIQTDKSVYNGGQLVKFRIFTLKSDLTPVTEPIDRIWIENPNGIHLRQWLNESRDRGFVNKTFQLSEEPMPGTWFVKMKNGHHEPISRGFRVENYVLPKFSVAIKAPEYMTKTGNVTICAEYHFGEPVHGVVVLEYFVKCSFSYYCQENGSSVTKNLRLGQDGCVDHKINLKSVSNFARSLMLNATVVEDGTKTKATALSRIEMRNSKKRNLPEFSSETKRRKFKPGLPFRGEIILNPRSKMEEKVIVCFDSSEMKSCRELSVWKNKSEFLLLPLQITNERNFKASIEVRSLAKEANESQVTKLNLVTWYSPSGSYIQTEKSSGEPLKCDRMAKFNVLYSISNSSLRFHYLVKSRGIILTGGNLDEFSVRAKPFELDEESKPINLGNLERVKRFEFDILVSSVMSPRAQLLVYAIRDDGEVVADALLLDVEKCLPNRVKTKWGKFLIRPGSDADLRIETSSNSFCALAVSDKSVRLISSSNSIDSEKVLKKFEKFETGSDSLSNHCREDEKEVKNQFFFTDGMETSFEPKQMDSRFVDSLQAFQDFGGLVITDLDLETRPCNVKDERGKQRTNETMRNSRFNQSGSEIENISMFTPAEESPKPEEANGRESPLDHDLRTYFPETWIWDLIEVDTSGSAHLNLKVPDTITEWVADAICFSENGLGIAEPSKMVTYKPFFLDFFVPRSLNRREIFHLKVSVFNYESYKLPVKITYRPTASFISKSEESASYCIRPKSKVVHRFVLEAVKLGEGQLSVRAEIDPNFIGDCGNAISLKSDTVVKKTTIKHEGFPVEEVKSGFICGDGSNFESRVDWKIKIPHEVAENSIALEASVSGDILGPSLMNLDRLIMLPTGCGEQNMILLAPNILILDYLLSTKAEDAEPIEKALKNLDLGYQRQLNYMRLDGSYSAFGNEDAKGSIWLTAFVVRYLSQAKRYIYVDQQSLNSSVAWIVKHQLENGCFPAIGKIYHRNFQEKLLEEDSSKTLTAYILISLIESGMSKDDPVIKNAIYCLRPTPESLGSYGDLLSSYALILAGEYRDSQGIMMELIKDAKRSYGMLWWESGDSIESAIEMTGYGILTLIKLGGPHFMAIASDALRWIIQFENKNGGFVSSQDTVLALEALSKFSSTLPKTSESDLLTVTVRAMEDVHAFEITNANKMLQQKIDLPSFPTSVNFESTGQGCALVQTYLRYNVRRGKPSDDLKVQLRIHSVSEIDSYSIAKFHICIRYKTGREKINMAVLEVSMVSGYYPDRSSLYEIKTTRKGVRRWEEYENQVNFYFEDLKNRKVCVDFLVAQEACVENAAPAIIKLYDYYDTQHQTTMKYNLASECGNASWSDIPRWNQIKRESKRELRYLERGSEVPRRNSNGYKERFDGFADFEHDLETPSGIGGVMPVYALPPNLKEPGLNCAHCPTAEPELFPQLYCSSQVAFKAVILGKEVIRFCWDVSPRTNFTQINRIVSITTRKECECPILNSVNAYALILVTFPRSLDVYAAREMHLDDSVQIYPWENSDEIPVYLRNAIEFCRKWWTFN